MVEEEEKEEENNKSFLGKIQDLDVDIKTRGHHDGGEAGRRGVEHWDVNAPLSFLLFVQVFLGPMLFPNPLSPSPLAGPEAGLYTQHMIGQRGYS
ncbi:unnamed protein product [Boreogadus saida]